MGEVNLFRSSYSPSKLSQLFNSSRCGLTYAMAQLHRTCLSQPPLTPVHPDDLPDMITPMICFVSVPRSKLRISGPFEGVIKPLLDKAGVPQSSAERCTYLVSPGSYHPSYSTFQMLCRSSQYKYKHRPRLRCERFPSTPFWAFLIT